MNPQEPQSGSQPETSRTRSGPDKPGGPAPPACPRTSEVLRLYRSTEPEGAAELEALAAHVEACEACRRAVRAESDEAALEDDLRHFSRVRWQTRVDVNVPLARLNELLDDYEVIREIGRGGMGIVYEARQKTLNRTVALKVLPALLGAVRPDAITRFRREAELAASLDHTNIVSVHDFGDVDGTLYYAMQLIDGRSLADVLREIDETGAIDVVLGAVSDQPSAVSQRQDAPTPQASAVQSEIRSPKSEIEKTRIGSSGGTDRAYYRRVAGWIADVAEAVHYAHEQGVIHRDVKPSNLLLSTDGRMLISDFGLARAAGLETVTAPQALLGTARYMSPEQVDDSLGPIDERIDVYGLGATLYELLAFQPMFAAADDREVLDCVLNKEPAPPHRFVRPAPRELETICLKAVEKDRAKRYATAKELRDDLERWLLGLPILAKRPSLAVRAVKLVRRRKVAAGLAGVAAVLFIATGILYAGYHSSRQQEAETRVVAQSRGAELLLLAAKKDKADGRYESAMRNVEQVLAQQPDSIEAEFLRARILRHLGRHDEGIQCLEDLVARHPDYAPAHFILALAYKPTRHGERLHVYHAPREAQRRNSPTDLEKKFAFHQAEAERLGLDDVDVNYLLALGEPNPERAVSLLTKVLDAKPGHLSAALERGNLYRELGQYEAMLRDAERAVGARPDWWITHEMRGRALSALGRDEEAADAYTRAILMNPQRANLWVNRASVRIVLGRFEEALSDADEAVTLDPQCAGAYSNRGSARAELGDLDGALVDSYRAIELSPGDVAIYGNHCWLLRRAAQWSEVITYATQLIELAPNHVRGYRDRGLGHLHLGQYDEALADFNRAVDLSPRNAFVLLTRGMGHELAGAHQLAHGDYERAASVGGRGGAYATLWKYVLLRQAGDEEAAADVLAAHPIGANGAEWTGRLFELFLGKLSPEDLLAAAVTNDERAEAYYYIGRRALLDSRPDEATTGFTKCVALDRNDILETDFARALLNRSGKP